MLRYVSPASRGATCIIRAKRRTFGGAFFQQQLDCCLDCGAEILYIAMFDEIDEGTAIFKTARRVPTAAPGSTFVPLDKGIKSDHYLKLVGEAAKRLRENLKDKH